MKKGDWAAAALVLLLAGGIFCATLAPAERQSVTVEIYLDGALLYSAPVSQNAAVPVSGDYNATVRIENGEVYISDSDCPGGDCLRMGRKTRAGETIFCLPNRLEVRLAGGGLDMIAG